MAKRNPIPGAPKRESWRPPEWDLPDAAALQALSRGDASPDMQKRALKYIVESLAGTYDMAYRPESSRDTDFALGRVFVGQQIVKLLKINLSAIRNKPSEQG